MKVKISGATGAQLDWLVAKCEGFVFDDAFDGHEVWGENPDGRFGYSGGFNYSTDWAQGGPLLEREKIATFPIDHFWNACRAGEVSINGPTPLIAAMRCFVASKLGDEVEVPDEL